MHMHIRTRPKNCTWFLVFIASGDSLLSLPKYSSMSFPRHRHSLLLLPWWCIVEPDMDSSAQTARHPGWAQAQLFRPKLGPKAENKPKQDINHYFITNIGIISNISKISILVKKGTIHVFWAGLGLENLRSCFTKPDPN